MDLNGACFQIFSNTTRERCKAKLVFYKIEHFQIELPASPVGWDRESDPSCPQPTRAAAKLVMDNSMDIEEKQTANRFNVEVVNVPTINENLLDDDTQTQPSITGSVGNMALYEEDYSARPKIQKILNLMSKYNTAAQSASIDTIGSETKKRPASQKMGTLIGVYNRVLG